MNITLQNKYDKMPTVKSSLKTTVQFAVGIPLIKQYAAAVSNRSRPVIIGDAAVRAHLADQQPAGFHGGKRPVRKPAWSIGIGTFRAERTGPGGHGQTVWICLAHLRRAGGKPLFLKAFRLHHGFRVKIVLQHTGRLKQDSPAAAACPGGYLIQCAAARGTRPPPAIAAAAVRCAHSPHGGIKF